MCRLAASPCLNCLSGRVEEWPGRQRARAAETTELPTLSILNIAGVTKPFYDPSTSGSKLCETVQNGFARSYWIFHSFVTFYLVLLGGLLIFTSCPQLTQWGRTCTVGQQQAAVHQGVVP